MAYLPHTSEDVEAMLAAIGVRSVEDLFADIPKAARLDRPLKIPGPLAEWELLRQAGELSRRNRSLQEWVSFLGKGYYDRFIPAAVEALASRGEFATAYTPYQPELSQGTLAAIFEYQTMIAGLTGTYAAQASMYDGASAAAEACLLAMNHTGRRKVGMGKAVHPEVQATIRTYLRVREATAVEVADGRELAASCSPEWAAVVWQYPDAWGGVDDLAPLAEAAHRVGALFIAVADPVALAVLKPPGAVGADVVVGEGQSLGIPLSYGGPGLGFFAVQAPLLRRLPGRLVGETRDREGRRGFVLTLQAREQHIRREHATSNICSNHSLNALRAAIYLALLGPQGLREVAERSAAGAHYLAEQLEGLGLKRVGSDRPFLYEFVVSVPGEVGDLNRHLLTQGILGGVDLGRWRPEWKGYWQLAVTEKRTRAECDRLVEEVRRWMSG